MQRDKNDGEIARRKKKTNAFMEKERTKKRESYVPVEKLGQRAHKKRKIEVNERESKGVI